MILNWLHIHEYIYFYKWFPLVQKQKNVSLKTLSPELVQVYNGPPIIKNILDKKCVASPTTFTIVFYKKKQKKHKNHFTLVFDLHEWPIYDLPLYLLITQLLLFHINV